MSLSSCVMPVEIVRAPRAWRLWSAWEAETVGNLSADTLVFVEKVRLT